MISSWGLKWSLPWNSYIIIIQLCWQYLCFSLIVIHVVVLICVSGVFMIYSCLLCLRWYHLLVVSDRLLSANSIHIPLRNIKIKCLFSCFIIPYCYYYIYVSSDEHILCNRNWSFTRNTTLINIVINALSLNRLEHQYLPVTLAANTL